MTHWNSDDIPWQDFDPAKLDSDIMKVVRAASMVERNAADYTHYLKNVFRGEPAFLAVADAWQAEEEQHGNILGRYAEMADGNFVFQRRFDRFVAGYRIPLERMNSVRGSLTGELLARCIVETGTSSLYSAIRDATDEPVLKAICHRIAGDEFRHYKMFYELMHQTLKRESIHIVRRALVAIARLRETDDDELCYAWFAANEPFDAAYDREYCARQYGSRAFSYYRDKHAERAVNMIMKAVGFETTGWLAAKAKIFAKKKMMALAAA